MVDEEIMAASVGPAAEPEIEETTTAAQQGRSKNKAKQQVDWRQEADLEAVTHLFLACARCGYFLAGYQLIFDDLASAVSQSADNWLTLSWNKAVRLLLHNSFGCQLDVDLLHYAGRCPECQRVFVYQLSEEQPPETIFRIQLRPR